MPVFYRQIMSMGTSLDIVLPEIDEAAGYHLLRKITDLLDDLVSQLSNYQVESLLSKINREAFLKPVKLSGIALEFISEGIRFNELTLGLFDFSLGAWTSKPDLIPDNGERLKCLLQLPFKERLRLQDDYLELLHEDVRIDSGGIGKGLAMKIIKKLLEDLNIQSAFISFGRSAVLGMGTHPHGDCWKIGIQHPENDKETLSEINLQNSSLSVSGNSINNRKKFGTRGHILHPKTGRFMTESGLVSVVSDDPLEAEVLSTALIIADKQETNKIKSIFQTVNVEKYLVTEK